MSEIKVNKISPRTACGTTTLGDSGDTISIPAGVTITNNGTQTGFGRTGAVDWDTTAKTAGFTGVSGNGYFINTSSGAITVNLPASPNAGDIMAVMDYAGTAATNKITIGRNSSNINGATNDLEITKNNSSIILVYVDGTQGWKGTETGNLSDIKVTAEFICASGGTETTSGDFKIHTFTGPGTFTVGSVGNPLGSTTVDYLVLAGGGAGGMGQGGGGGGAGGYRESSGAASGCYSASPLGSGVNALSVCAQAYPITVGGGGAGQTRPDGNPYAAPGPSGAGANSIFSTITSTGGGMGGAGAGNCQQPGFAGGSGGGGGGRSPPGSPGTANPGGAGNTPPVSPSQGNAGGLSNNLAPTCTAYDNGGGGGGAGGVGANSGQGPGTDAGNGGNGTTSSINASPVARGGGGGGGACHPSSSAGSGGPGGGANGKQGPGAGPDASANLGGGGGGNGSDSGQGARAGNGGSGVVIIRYKFQ